MPVQNQSGIDEVKAILEEVGKQLLDASTLWDICIQLWPTIQVVKIINRYKGFFQPTRKAIFDQFSIKICNVTSNDAHVPSFNKVFRLLDLNPEYAPDLDVRTLRKRLKKHKKVLEAVNNYRNTKAAHWDVKNRKDKEKPILFGDCQRTIKELQDVFNQISGAVAKKGYSFKYVQHNDTTTLLQHLDELVTIHEERIEKLSKNPGLPEN
jgi:hypothetical protein